MKEINVLSLGVGVQSSSLALLAAHKEIAPYDHIVFADTGFEPKEVYQYLTWLQDTLKQFPHMPPISITSFGNIRDDMARSADGSRRANPPLFVKNEDGSRGILIRKCTTDYKILPVQKKVRELAGFTRKAAVYKGDVRLKVHMSLGISTDESQRVRTNREAWINNVYPLLENDMSRYDCMTWVADKGYPVPPKSACIGCPYRDNQSWADMKINDPDSFRQAVEFDKSIRYLKGVKGECYLHSSLIPLDEIDFTHQLSIFDGVDMFTFDCQGMCGL